MSVSASVARPLKSIVHCSAAIRFIFMDFSIVGTGLKKVLSSDLSHSTSRNRSLVFGLSRLLDFAEKGSKKSDSKTRARPISCNCFEPAKAERGLERKRRPFVFGALPIRVSNGLEEVLR